MHRPVLCDAVIKGLAIHRGGLYIDATFGEGGHALEIIRNKGRVLGIELDPEQYRRATVKYQKYISKTKELILEQGNFKDIAEIAKKLDFYPVDGIVFDLGLSMEQLSNSQRGFSFKNPDAFLDMRINPRSQLTAADIVNQLDEESLFEILARYGEEIRSRAIAREIVRLRRRYKITTVGSLIAAIDRVVGTKNEAVYRRVFQALRIAVNQELDNLKAGLTGSLEILKPDGRIAVITFHSVEDRLVKQFAKQAHLSTLGKQVIVGDDQLSYERSAKLRILIYDNPN